MDLVLILGLGMTAVTLVFAGRRVLFLGRLITSGQPAPDRLENVTKRLGESLKTQVVEVFAQKKLLKWSVPGAAHFFVFWAFLILSTVYLEAYGALFDPQFHIPIVGTWPILGFAQDFIAVMALVGLVVFANIRLKNSPAKLGRKSRFSGSHLGGAWLVLLMIFNVIWTMFLFRGAAVRRRQPALRQRRLRLDRPRQPARRAQPRHARDPRARRPAAPHRRDAGVPDPGAELQAPAHLPGPAQRAVRTPPGRARRGQAADVRRASRSPSTTSTTSTRTRSSGSARSRTSPGRASSTSRPAPSAVAARTSARPGTPRSRCRRSC